MAHNKPTPPIRQRALDLQKQRQDLMALPPQQVVEAILNAERPVELVHSFAEEDLYLLVSEVGHQDALPILSLASARQWEYMLDMDVWEGDTVNSLVTTQWLALLMVADPARLARWCADEKKEFTELFLQRNVDVATRTEDQDPADLGQDFITLDDVFYFRLKDLPLEAIPGPDSGTDPEATDAYRQFLKQRERFFPALLEQIADYDVQFYRNLLLESAAVLPAETEEELYRQRNVRLAEKGFLPLEEAVGVYQPINPEELCSRPHKHIEKGDAKAAAAPQSFGSLLEEGTHLSKALATIDRSRIARQLQAEFATLCNSIIVADRKTVQTRQALGDIVKKACSYTSIGLESIDDDHRRLIQTYPLADLFRIGYGRALRLKWKADAWQKASWYAGVGLPLSFWGQTYTGVVGGLLIKKPLFFDNYASGTIYREFQTVDDILCTEKQLDCIAALDDLFRRLSIESIPEHAWTQLSYKKLLLTLWAAHSLERRGHPLAIRAIPMGTFKPFFRQLWDKTSRPRAIGIEKKQAFMDWLSDAGKMPIETLSNDLGMVFEELFREIEEEYAGVAADDLDPRFIKLFWVTAP